MKKIILVAVLSGVMTLGGTSLYAWGWGHHGGGWGYHHGYGMGYGNMNYLADELNLTDQQVDKIIKIDAEYNARYYQNRDNYDKIYSLRQEHRKAVYDVLTDKQKKKFDATFDSRRGFGNCGNW